MLNRLGGVVATLALAITAVAVSGGPAHAIGDKDCADFDSQRQAQIFFLNNGGPDSDPHGLDDDGDGIACESNPAPYYYGTTPPGSNPGPTVIRSKVGLSLTRVTAIRGELVRLRAAVSPRGVRTVVFQRRADGRWRALERTTTGPLGKASHAVRAPRSSTRYRVVLLSRKVGDKRFTAATSDPRGLRVLRQQVELTLSRSSISEGGRVTARVEARPVRDNRPVALQEYRAGSWQTVRTSRENARGIVRFRVPTASAGTHRLRAVVSRFHGAAPARSSVDRLVVRDVTPPQAPTNVSAMAGDGSAEITWSPSTEADLTHYVVYVRSSGSAWTWLGEPTDEAWMATGLTNGVTYEFAIAAVDQEGNASTLSVAVSVTPEPPIALRLR